ncbi:hypothetical protein PInf_011512 [Phytophthora infestans]|nr:hypothetical protein PInf_011512 [Phytophthora infestans]
MPRVMFVGSREAWSGQRKRYSALYTIPPGNVYKWLAVLSGINNVFREEGIQVVDTPKRRELLRVMASSVEACVHISESAVVSAIDEETEGNSGVRDESLSGVDDTVIVRSSAVLPNIEQSDPAVIHEVIDAMAATFGDTRPGQDNEAPARVHFRLGLFPNVTSTTFCVTGMADNHPSGIDGGKTSKRRATEAAFFGGR